MNLRAFFGLLNKYAVSSKCLEVLHGHHHNCVFPFAGYRNSSVVVAYLLHGLGKIAASGGIAYAFHSHNSVHVHKSVRYLAVSHDGYELTFVMLRGVVLACILPLAGCSSAISSYISSRQSFGYEQIASRETLLELGFYESEFCSKKTELCISYLTADSLSEKQKLSYRVELHVKGLKEVNQLEIQRDSAKIYSGLVVLIHGFRASKEYMVNSALYFRFLGFDVLLPDLLGHGDSSPGVRFGVEDSKIINELIDKLDHSEKDILIVGNSLGAVAATLLMDMRRDIGGIVLQAPMIRFDQAAVNYIDAYSPFLSTLIPRASIEKGAGKALKGAGVKLEQTDIIPLLVRSEIPTLILVSTSDPVAPPESYKEISNGYISVAEVSARSHPSMAVITQQDDEIVQGWLVGKANTALQWDGSPCAPFCAVATLPFLRKNASKISRP